MRNSALVSSKRSRVIRAAQACADDTKGQMCFICTQALHWKTKEGLVRGCSCRGTAGFAHVSCLAEQAKILFAEAEENNLGWEAKNPRWARWCECSLCEQEYHGVVRCALGWACWKTHLGRPEDDQVLLMAMSQLGNGLYEARHYEEALLVNEAELAMKRRLGLPERRILAAQGNLASTYGKLGHLELTQQLYRDVYSGRLRLDGEEHVETLQAANNYASSLIHLECFEEAKSLMCKTMPVARRVLGDSHDTTLRTRWIYAQTLYMDDNATLDDLREAESTLKDTVRLVRRMLGGAHPITVAMEKSLRTARAWLRARESDDVESTRELVAAMVAGDA